MSLISAGSISLDSAFKSAFSDPFVRKQHWDDPVEDVVFKIIRRHAPLSEEYISKQQNKVIG